MLPQDILAFRMDRAPSPRAVATRIAVRASDIAMPIPGRPLRITLRWVDGTPLLLVPRASPHPLVDLAPWIDALGARTIRNDDEGLWIQCQALSELWARLFRHVRLDAAELLPNGNAVLELTASRWEIATFTRLLAQAGASPRLERVAPIQKPPSLLTPSQDEAIRAAAAHGYYEIPRPLNLHDLAERMGVSSGSLSERLRRAEQRLVRRYIETHDEGTTLRDADTLAPRENEQP